VVIAIPSMRGADFVGKTRWDRKVNMTRHSIETLAVILGLLVAFTVSWYIDGTWAPSH
jgi:hypothetical protein